MTYKCRICGANEVDKQGDICELCAIGQDPYAQNQTPSHGTQATSQLNNGNHNNVSYSPKRGSNRKVLLNDGKSLDNQDPYGNDMTTSDTQPSVQVYAAGQVPQTSQQTTTVVNATPVSKMSGIRPITTGITKNISVDNQKKSILAKWFRALFTGIPFTLDDDVTMFQVFPDFLGTSLNALGNACDQVIVYGKLNNGVVSENNDVEVYGHRDANNNVIAKKIKNKASGTIITPARALSPGWVWFVTAIVFALLTTVIWVLGVEGIIWTGVIILCLVSLPKILKVLGFIFALWFSFSKRHK